jgi:hypothetical protein
MINCSQCNQEIPNEARYCTFCGGQVSSIVQQDKPADVYLGDHDTTIDIDNKKNVQESIPDEKKSEDPLFKENENPNDSISKKSQSNQTKSSSKFEIKPLLQLLALLVVVGILLAFIWK